MKRAEAAFALYLAVLVAGAAFMSFTVAGSAVPAARSRGQVTATTALRAGAVPPTRPVRAIELRW
jgi:hypothetical protein